MNEMTSALADLQQKNVAFKLHTYPTENGPVAAMDVAAYMNFSPERLIKTLVTTDHHGGYFVFCLPAENRIDMKKAARLAGTKKLTMLDPDKFEALTGYVHGGCSPFGLKTPLPIFVEEEALQWESVYISGGRIGLTVEVCPHSLLDRPGAQVGQFTRI